MRLSIVIIDCETTKPQQNTRGVTSSILSLYMCYIMNVYIQCASDSHGVAIFVWIIPDSGYMHLKDALV